MNDEKISLKTETGQVIEVVILEKRADRIVVVLGQGVHSVKTTVDGSLAEIRLRLPV